MSAIRGAGSNTVENRDPRAPANEDAGGLFRAWLEMIIEDFRNGNHSGDPRRLGADAREHALRTRGRRPNTRADAATASHAATFNSAETSALTALGGLSRGPELSPGGGGGGPGGHQPIVSLSELIRSA